MLRHGAFGALAQMFQAAGVDFMAETSAKQVNCHRGTPLLDVAHFEIPRFVDPGPGTFGSTAGSHTLRELLL
jgi:hypothetical protein